MPNAVEMEKDAELVAVAGDERLLLSKNGETSILRLQGAVDIAVAAQLKAGLLAAFEDAPSVEVHLEHVSDLDVTALQLLWAARQRALRSNTGFVIREGTAQTLASALEELGMSDLLGPV